MPLPGFVRRGGRSAVSRSGRVAAAASHSLFSSITPSTMPGLSALLGGAASASPVIGKFMNPLVLGAPTPSAAADPSSSPALSAFLSLLLGQLPPPPAPADALKTAAETVEKDRVPAGPAPAAGFTALEHGAFSAIAGFDSSFAEAHSGNANADVDAGSARREAPVLGVDEGLGIERIESSRLAGRDAVRIDLRPEGLGAVSLRLEIRNGGVTAVVLATSEATVAALRPEIAAARAALAAAGVDVASLVVAARKCAASGDGNGEGAGELSEDGVAPIDGRSPRRRRTRFDFTV